MKNVKLWLGLFLILGCLWADTNNSITFQGYLTNNDFEPLQGTVKMGFVFYKNSTGTDNTDKLFDLPSNRNTRTVTVFNGNYTTKIEFSDTEITTLNTASDVWIQVYVTDNISVADAAVIATNNYALDTRIQFNAVPYALSVRGVYYDSGNDILKLGKNNQSVAVNPTTTLAADDPRRGGLIVQGKVSIGGAGLAGSSPILQVIDDLAVTGNVNATGKISANQVFGAVWN